MGLMDSLFGGTSSSETQRTYISPEQMPFLKQLWGSGQQLYQDATQPDYMNQAISGGVDYLNQRQPVEQAAGALSGQLTGADPTQALNRMMSGQVNLDPYNQAYQAAANQATQAYQEGVPLSRLQSYFTSGAPSTRTGLKLLQEGRGFGQGLQNMAAQMYLPAYQQAQEQALGASDIAAQRQSGALQQAPSIFNLGYQPYQEQLNLGQQQMNLPWLPLMNYANIVGNPAMVSEGQRSASGTQGGIADMFSFTKKL